MRGVGIEKNGACPSLLSGSANVIHLNSSMARRIPAYVYKTLAYLNS